MKKRKPLYKAMAFSIFCAIWVIDYIFYRIPAKIKKEEDKGSM